MCREGKTLKHHVPNGLRDARRVKIHSRTELSNTNGWF
jgi:hypothetical protein